MTWQLILAGFLGGFAVPTVTRILRFFMADTVEVERATSTADVVTTTGSSPRLMSVRESYWWRIKARNGQIVATSETYDSAGNARKMGKKYAKRYGCKYKDHTKGGK